MKVADLIQELENADPDAEVRVVQQPNYPLVADIKEGWEGAVEFRGATVYIHLENAYDYYSSAEEDEEEEEEEEEEDQEEETASA